MTANLYSLKLSPYHKIFYNEWKLDPITPKYNIVFDQTLSNNLDITQLKIALERFISDHLLLNSHIVEIDNEYYWEYNHIISLLELVVQNDPHIIYDYVVKPFDLNHGPLYRFAVFNESDGNYRFVIVLHHIVIDGASGDEFISKISEYYNNQNSSIAILEQLNEIKSTTELFDSQINKIAVNCQEFWDIHLKNIEEIDLKFLKSDQNIDNFSNVLHNLVKEIRFEFDNENTSRLKHICRTYSITPYLYSMCIFALLLHKYTSQEQFAISYPVAIAGGRNFICGVKVNTNIIPFKITSTTTLFELFNTVKQFIKSLKQNRFNYSYYPIDKIILNANKNLLNVVFAQTHLKYTKFNFSGVKVLAINNEFNIDFEKGLLFEQEIKNGIISYRIRCKAIEVDENILSNFIKHYNKLFIDVLVDLEQHLTNRLLVNYQILDKIEYQKIVYDWNKTERYYPNTAVHRKT